MCFVVRVGGVGVGCEVGFEVEVEEVVEEGLVLVSDKWEGETGR